MGEDLCEVTLRERIVQNGVVGEGSGGEGAGGEWIERAGAHRLGGLGALLQRDGVAGGHRRQGVLGIGWGIKVQVREQLRRPGNVIPIADGP